MGPDTLRHPPVSLPLPAATRLGAALVTHVAERESVRVLIVKGLVTSHYGLRRERVSADVDVLVDPDHVDHFLEALRECGWRDRPMTAVAAAVAAHSQELIHDAWPCDIDVHHRFPGLLSEPPAAFDALWERRASLVVAGVDCPIPNRDGALLITALHALRHVDTDAHHTEELAGIDRALELLAPPERATLATLAERTGADAPLADLLRSHGVSVEARPSDALTDWNTRRNSGDTFAGNVVAGLSSAPWRARPRLAWLAVWPSAHDMRATHPEIGPRRAALLRARARRLGRGLAQLPRALAAKGRASNHGGDA